MNSLNYDPRFPDVDLLRHRARRRIPRFAFEYLDGGCNEEVNLRKNTEELRRVELRPYYLREYAGVDLRTELFGHTYDAPFGIAPIGLQGMMWPRASEILAKAAFEANIPYILSTVATADIETIAQITEGQAWFQLYHPTDDALRDDLLDRCYRSGIRTLVILCDVPTFGYRSREIINGLSMPPRLNLRNLLQIMGRPEWAVRTLLAGPPMFKTMQKYLPDDVRSLKHLGEFMNRTFTGRLSETKIATLRDRWPGNLVMKGVATLEDAETCIRYGLDGLIVSNHGGRQLDAGESTIRPLTRIAGQCDDRITVMMDSGIRSGPDIARTLASGAQFAFLGRAFMYGVAALGERGGDHTVAILKRQLQQVMEQVCCARPADLPRHLSRHTPQ